MKLQRNNKYSKRIASGILSLVVGVGLLQGCKDNSKIETTYPIKETTIYTEPTYVDETESTEPIITEPTEVTEPYDDMSMRKLPDDELKKEIDDLCIVFSDAKYCMAYFFSVMFKNSSGEDKVMLATINLGETSNEYVVRDLFTREILFEYISNEQNYSDNLRKNNIEIKNENEYFCGATNVCVDVDIAMINYVMSHGVALNSELFLSYYPEHIKTGELYFTMEEMAERYINLIPEKFRVDAADLGVKSIPEENKKYVIGG